MATISVGAEKTGRRALTHELPLVPFIDFMVCLIAFLMVTAVWTQLSRINANASVPGEAPLPSGAPRKELHVSATSSGFELRWLQGRTVVTSRQVPRVAVGAGNEQRYPTLTRAITEAWQTDGQHRAAHDRELDRAVLHVDSDLPFAEIVAVLDSLHAPRRGTGSAFDVAFAAN
ncbi:MAG: biopolymer transporter [Polyangiaceae bacterium]|jgi:biopolymer transport protein ExbD|nr:biopolymer transporter [Polyangiaceae bacterium]